MNNSNTTYKDSPLGKIPGDWEVKTLKECCLIKGEYGINAAAVEYSKELPTYIRITDINDDGYYSGEKKVSVNDDNSNNFILNAGDIVFARTGATVGKTYLYDTKDGELVFAGFLIRFRPNKKCLLTKFLKYFTSTNLYWNWVKTVSMRSGQPGINAEEYGSIKIPLPLLPEQKAIAHVLGLMDSAINTNNNIIAKKELQKKWLMQKLLTGNRRLKGFAGEWKQYHLGSLGDTYSGLTGKSKQDFGRGKPYIPYLNIFSNFKIDLTNFDYVEITEHDKQNKAKYGDIFFTVSSETPDEVGMASVLLDHVDELYLNSFCFGFRVYNFKTMVPEFSSYFLRADAFREEIYKLSQGATRFNLSKNNLMKLNVILPNPEEQSAIAKVLQTADKEIQLLKTKTEKLREQKRGLMQVLLTGKKRLSI